MSIPTNTPQLYTVPESKIWISPDGKDSFFFYQDDVISMQTAIRMGMPGAGYDTRSPFGTVEEQRIIDLIGQNAGGGVPSLTLSFWDRYYDNRTAGAGVEASYAIFPYTMVGGLIRVEEPNMQITTVGFRVTTAKAATTARVSIYGIYAGTDSARGLAGTLVMDCGTVSVATTGYKSRNAFAPVDPGLYWIMVEPSDNITIAGFQSHSGQLGTSETSGTVNSGMSANIGGNPLDPHPASINGGNITQLAPLVYFQLDAA